MVNTRIKEPGVPLWAMALPAIGVPLMVALLALTVPKPDTSVEALGNGEITEVVERQAVELVSGLPAHCAGHSVAAGETAHTL